jgi:hypothetical protein
MSEITRYILDDHLRDEDPDGDWVSAGNLDMVLRDLKTVVTYLEKIGKVPLSKSLLKKYKDDFERIDLQ